MPINCRRLHTSILPLLLLVLSNHSLADPTAPPADFCAWAQEVIASTSLQASVEVHSERESFIESKAFDHPFTVQQFSAVPVSPDSSLNTVTSCKMRTAERINNRHSVTAGTPVAGPDTSCEEVHRRMLADALAAIPAGEQQVPADRWVVEEEELTFIGPRWLDPWPFVPVVAAEDGRLQLRTRALYVPHAWWIPMPERFLGNYYCHLVSPPYLEALIRGELSVR
jgi:hypothetical protein